MTTTGSSCLFDFVDPTNPKRGLFSTPWFGFWKLDYLCHTSIIPPFYDIIEFQSNSLEAPFSTHNVEKMGASVSYRALVYLVFYCYVRINQCAV